MGNFKSQAPLLKEKLRKAIRSWMKEANLSQGEVGRRTGMDRRNVNKTICGTETKVSIDQFIRIANGAGLKIDWEIKKPKKEGKQ